MKTVYLIRHAKSSWEDPGSDFDRPLNERGKKAAPDMANRLKKKKIVIDRLISSPAKRAKQTALLFASELNYDKEQILYDPELYLAGVPALLKAIQHAPEDANSIAIFSHNPGITEFANTLTPVRIDDMPTAAVYAVQAHCTGWQEFGTAKKEFLFFDYPKLHQ